jgi:hypothetical protein
MRDRRARSHTSQENLVKDSSSDVSPRESASSAIADRRRQRRTHRSPTDQQYDNQAFAEDERPLPPTIERADDDEEEENIENADRLVSHVAKEHHRKKNEVQQQNKKSKKKPTTTTSDDVDHDQDDVHQQIREQQEILSKHVANKDDDDGDRVLPLEPLPSTLGTGREKSLDQLLERARRSRTGKSIDDG